MKKIKRFYRFFLTDLYTIRRFINLDQMIKFHTINKLYIAKVNLFKKRTGQSALKKLCIAKIYYQDL